MIEGAERESVRYGFLAVTPVTCNAPLPLRNAVSEIEKNRIRSGRLREETLTKKLFSSTLISVLDANNTLITSIVKRTRSERDDLREDVERALKVERCAKHLVK